MSTYFLPNNLIPWTKIKNLKGEITVEETENTTKNSRVLHDSEGNYLWANKTANGGTSFTRYGRNNETNIISFLENKFKVTIFTESTKEFNDLVDSDYSVKVVKVKEDRAGKRNRK